MINERRIIVVEKNAPVLVVEDRPGRQRWFTAQIPWAQFADLAHLANRMIRQSRFNFIFLDFDLHYFTSRETAELLSKLRYPGRVFIHSLNSSGPELLQQIMNNLEHVELTPFGTFEIEITERRRHPR